MKTSGALQDLELRVEPAGGRQLGVDATSDVDERLFAVRGLANLGGDLAIDAALIAASRDKDWRIAFEALQGLGKSSARLSLEAMAAAASLENHHLRVAAIESATAQFDAFAKTEWMGTTPGVGRFDPSWAESSPAVRAAAMANMFQVTPEPALNADPSPHVRAALIRQHGRESRATTTPYFSFDEIESETDPLVLGAYIERWGELPDYEGPVDLPDYLGYADNGIRLAAVNALLARKQPKVEIGALARCYETSKGEVSTEVRFNLLKLAAKIGGDGALQLLDFSSFSRWPSSCFSTGSSWPLSSPWSSFATLSCNR